MAVPRLRLNKAGGGVTEERIHPNHLLYEKVNNTDWFNDNPFPNCLKVNYGCFIPLSLCLI